MRLAVIADVHGNAIALDAVLRDIANAAPDLVVNLGDLVSGPFDPATCADAQMALGCPTIRGNHERQVLNGGMGPSDAFARSLLSAAHLSWIEALPATLALLDSDVFACHGSPAGGDLEYLLEDVSTGRPTLAPADLIEGRLKGSGQANLILCAHTHVARVVTAGGKLVVNPGSVGMPAYRDTAPVVHVMEAGSPHARYAVVTRRDSGWNVELRTVAYNFEAAAEQADRNGRPDLAAGARTGRMPVTGV